MVARIESLPPQLDDENAQGSSNPPLGQMVEPAIPPYEAAPLPREFALGSLRDGRLRVVEPFEVAWKEEAGSVVVEAEELKEFGFGDSVSAALADLQAAIAQLYFTLEAEQGRLGADLAAVKATLNRKLRRADATLST